MGSKEENKFEDCEEILDSLDGNKETDLMEVGKLLDVFDNTITEKSEENKDFFCYHSNSPV